MKKIGIIRNVKSFGIDKKSEDLSSSELMSAVGGNSGNLAFIHGAKKILANPLVDIDWGTDVNFINTEVDHIIICCANQLGSHVDLIDWADRLKHFSKPVTLLGLGVQAANYHEFPKLPEGTLSFLKVVNEHNAGTKSNIGVRGNHTKLFLESYGFSSVPLGCPSLLISEKTNLGRALYDKFNNNPINKIIVCAGNPFDSSSSKIESMLLDIVNNFNGAYVIQHPLEMLQILKQEKVALSEDTRKILLDVYNNFDIDQLFEWFKNKSFFFTDCTEWINFNKNFNFALGPRYHGVALAIQSGIPGVVITIDARTRELCEGTGVPYVLYKEISNLNSTDFLKRINWSEESAFTFDKMRFSNSNFYFDFLNDQKLYPSIHLKSLMEKNVANSY